MKRLALFVGISLLAVTPARAAMPVIDMAALARWTQQLQQMAYQLETLQQQYRVAVQQFTSLNHLTNMGSIVPGLQAPMLANPLPSLGSIQGLIGGYGGGGALSGLFNGNLSANRVYTPTGDTWLAQHIQQDSQSIAGMQTINQQLYQSASQRIPQMQELVDQINTTSDPATAQELNNRLAAEEAIIQTQQLQAQSAANLYSAQLQLERQQLDERRQQNIDAVLQDAKANGIDIGQ